MQIGIVCLQAFPIALMEQTVISIHLVILGSIFFPDLLRLGRMEACRMLFIKRLHVRHLQNSLIIILEWLIVHTRPAFLYCPLDHIYINDMISDLCHQLDQDHFIQTRKDFRIHQITDLQLHEPLRQLQFIFHRLCNLYQLFPIFSMEPVRNKIKAERLMRRGNELVQSRQMFQPHRPCGCCQKHMRCQHRNIRLLRNAVQTALSSGFAGIHLVARSLVHHTPKSLIRTIVYKLLIQIIRVGVHTGLQHFLDDRRRRDIFNTAQSTHHSHVQLSRNAWHLVLTGNFIPAHLCFKKLPIVLHLFTHRRR